ncbi:MAG: hypothetical protein U9O89_04495 [Thermoproteota archaeon]|nr:hypothetical protein [Thermoproteota archaeon]
MSPKKLWKRLILRWSTRKGTVALILFLASAIFIEYVIVRFSLFLGVTDTNMLKQAFPFPGASLSFTITISPLFHLIPIGVVITLVFSWMHLLRHVAVLPHKIMRKKKTPKIEKKRRLKLVRSFFRRASQTLKSVSRRWRQLFFAQAAVKSALSVLAVSVVIAFVTYFLVYPSLIGNSTVEFYNSSPSALGFVTKTVEVANEVGRTLTPLGWLASIIDGALKAAAPGFRSTIQGFGTLTAPLVKLDAVGKYILCQNIAAWVPALIVLTYGQYASQRHRRRFKRK